MAARNLLKTLDRSLHILTLFETRQPEWGVTELANHLDLPKSVVQKTLATFVGKGFLHQDEISRRYRLGPRILSLARVAEPELARIAKPHLVRLTEEAKETAKLTVLDGIETVIVAAVESQLSLHMHGRVGRRNPVHSGASNKLLAAYADWATLEPAVRWRLAKETGAERADASPEADRRLKALRCELQAIVANGYAMSTGEREPGVKAVVVPVRGHGERVLASLSVVGPSERMEQTGDERLLLLLQQASSQISRAIGYSADDRGEGGDVQA